MPRLDSNVVAVCGAVCMQGKFEELQPGKRLVFSWRFNNWEEDCYSKVRRIYCCRLGSVVAMALNQAADLLYCCRLCSVIRAI
jgi:uncharacterized protein YndB with AHSA1/START domain